MHGRACLRQALALKDLSQAMVEQLCTYTMRQRHTDTSSGQKSVTTSQFYEGIALLTLACQDKIEENLDFVMASC